GPERRTHVVDVSSPAAPQLDAAAHSAQQVQAVWIGGAAPEPLRLGRAVDALFRTWETYGKPHHRVAACLEARNLDSTARHLLEARFGTVRCGVSAREFLLNGADARS